MEALAHAAGEVLAKVETAPALVRAPAPGETVNVRNRDGVVLKVQASGRRGSERRHLVEVEYCDTLIPSTERVIWELESAPRLRGLSSAGQLTGRPRTPLQFRSLIRAAMWSEVSAPVLAGSRGDMFAPGGIVPLAPVASSITPEDYQLVPLMKALEMPCVRLLLADGVGLGKTIEAGLIALELLLRRRISRICVLCPPGLRRQWADELRNCFGLDFEIVDGPATARLKRDHGREANPFEMHDRIIASCYYLRDDRVFENFLDSCKLQGEPRLPWDLLIVDEAHRLAPAARGPESALTRMLRALSQWFEHRVFLTATPHDGYAASYTGLLEVLDPVRFRRTAKPSREEERRMAEVVIRRLALKAPNTPVGKERRRVLARDVSFHDLEREVLQAFDELRKAVVSWGRIGHGSPGHPAAFAMSVLGKRLLSSIPAFAVSFRPFLEGIRTAGRGAGDPGERALCEPPEPAGDEREESRWLEVAQALGEWMGRYFPGALEKVERLAQALDALLVAPRDIGAEPPLPVVDSKFAELASWLAEYQPGSGRGERAVIFTEYVDTLVYLRHKIAAMASIAEGELGVITGALSQARRRECIEAFTTLESPLSILLTTDSTAEGLNLHPGARYVFHYDIPWNPAVLEQRIGRLDRYGQRCQVLSFHFVSSDAGELSFLAGLEGKVGRIRTDLEESEKVLATGRPHASGRNLPSPPKPLFGLPRPASSQARVCDTRSIPGLRDSLSRVRAGLHFTPPAALETLGAALAAADPVSAVRGPLRPGAPGLPYPGSPLARWAFARLLAQGAACRPRPAVPWAVFPGELPAGADAAIVLFVRHRAVNLNRETVLSRMNALFYPLRQHQGGWVLATHMEEGPFAREQDFVHGPAHQLLLPGRRTVVPQGSVATSRAIWADCGATVEALASRHQLLGGRYLERALARSGRAEEARVNSFFAQRREELAVLAGPRHQARLRRHLGRLHDDIHRRGYLFDELAAKASMEFAEAQRELGELESRLVRLKEAMDEEERLLVTKVMPGRFRLAHPLQGFLEGVAIVLPAEKWCGDSKVWP